MQLVEYHKSIIDYYRDTRNAYKDSWDLDNSFAIHYGYWDEKVNSFSGSLMRMNEVMMQKAGIRPTDHVLDAGCGVGGSSFFMAESSGCKVTGISISPAQIEEARMIARTKGLDHLVSFDRMDYCQTKFPDNHFDVVWGCESVCYAQDKQEFIREAYRILKPGGRLVIADGFVTEFELNKEPTIRNWLDGWKVNYLETVTRFSAYMKESGFRNIEANDISAFTKRSAKRLLKFFYLASLYVFWKRISFSKPPTDIQIKNINACKYQWLALRKNFWQYALICGQKP